MISFDTFVKKQAEKAEKARKKADFNPQQEIETFNNRVEAFYNSVCNEWLKDYVVNNRIQIKRKPIEIHEELLGTYQIDAMDIIIGTYTIQLRPVGTILIGTSGRIDISYLSKRGMFVLVGKSVTGPRAIVIAKEDGEKMPKRKSMDQAVWKFVDRSGNMKYINVNADTFQQIILDLINE